MTMAGGGKRAGGNDPARLAQMAAAPAVAAPELAPEGASPEQAAPLLPPHCPVEVLGVHGMNLVFLDRLKQVVETPPRGCGKGELVLWFGNDFLIDNFPQYPKGWKAGDPIKSFDQSAAQVALAEDCWRRGIFNPAGKVLGRGAHTLPADEDVLVLHLGNRVMLANTPNAKGQRIGPPVTHPPGKVRIGSKDTFFPALDALDPPADKAAGTAEARDVLELFSKWNWVDKAAPLMALGMIGQMFICGALKWRVHMWLPGPTASGKSSLQKIIRAMNGDWVLSTADASEAAIRQILGDDTLPVSIDEAEAHDDPERLQRVLNLMKKGSSGDQVLRGGADHKGQTFTAQSCFLLSSVLHAPMRGEDRNRIVMLEMRELPDDVPPLEMELARWRSTGRRLHRRIIEQWPRFNRTLDAYKEAIGRQRYKGRWQDTYGTLLACADMLLYDMEPRAAGESMVEEGVERVERHVAAIIPMMAKGRVEARTDVERVIQHLTSHPLPGAHGRPPEPVGTWLERAMTWRVGQFETDGPERDEEARAKLKAHGLRVVVRTQRPLGGFGIEDALPGETGWRDGFLAVAYATNKGISEIFRSSEWAQGGWVQSMKKIPGALPNTKVRFGQRLPDTAVLVPLAAFEGIEE